jgi:hypothetical protein
MVQSRRFRDAYQASTSRTGWIKRDASGVVMALYQLLPAVFRDMSAHDAGLPSKDNSIRDGGAAPAVYGQMQFEDMSDDERKEFEKALKKYCDPNALAMVMVHENWREFIG